MKKTLLAMMVGLALVMGTAAGAQEGPKNVLSNLNVTFYGYVKTDVIYNFERAYGLNYVVLAPPGNLVDGFLAPADEDQKRNNESPAFGVTARQTRFGAKIAGPTFGDGWQALGKFEGDFYGVSPKLATKVDSATGLMTVSSFEDENKGNFELRIAEVELKSKMFGILAGNEWMVMSPIYPHVSNYTAGAEMGNLGYRIPQVRFTTYLVDGKLQIQLAADRKLGDYMFFYDDSSGENSGAPDFQYGLVWDTIMNGKPFKLGFTGHYGVEELTDADSTRIKSWSYNGHMMLPLAKWLSLNGEYFYGANLDGWYTGGVGQGWVLDDNGSYHALRDQGGWGEIELGPISNFVIYAGYGEDNVNNDQLEDAGLAAVMNNGKPAFSAITRNSMIYGAVHYWVVPKSVDVSLDWMQVHTYYELAKLDEGAPVDWHNGIVNRLCMSFWLFF